MGETGGPVRLARRTLPDITARSIADLLPQHSNDSGNELKLRGACMGLERRHFQSTTGRIASDLLMDVRRSGSEVEVLDSQSCQLASPKTCKQRDDERRMQRTDFECVEKRLGVAEGERADLPRASAYCSGLLRFSPPIPPETVRLVIKGPGPSGCAFGPSRISLDIDNPRSCGSYASKNARRSASGADTEEWTARVVSHTRKDSGHTKDTAYTKSEVVGYRAANR
jgi:hypothetical protein